MPRRTTSSRFVPNGFDDWDDRPLSTRREHAQRFDAELRVCRKMRSKAAERVVQARLHRADRAVDYLSDLREVQAVHVMEHDDDAVLWSERVDRREHDPPHLGLLRQHGWRALLALERVVRRILERTDDHVLPRPPVVREIDGHAIEPRPEGTLGLETRERAMRAGKCVDRDLLSVRWIFRDREAEAEDAVAIPVEERVELEHVDVACGVHQLAIGAVLF